MAIIYTYPLLQETVVADDLLLMTDISDDKKTKSVKISALPFTNNAGTVTSVALTMPAAFAVANSPIITSGTLAVTPTGGASGQYLDYTGNWSTPAGGAANPAGLDTQVQYNDGGSSFGAGAFFTTNKSNKVDITYELGLKGDGSSNQGLLKLYCEAGTAHHVGIKGPNHTGGSPASYTIQLPNSLPAVANQILESNASGTLSWIPTPSGGGGGSVDSVNTTDGTYINLTPNSATTGPVTVTADLSAVDGTSDTSTRFLSKDNTWDVPSYTTNTDTTYTLTAPSASQIRLSDGSTNNDISLSAGSGVTISQLAANNITFINSDRGSSQYIFKTIAVSGQTSIAADSNADTLTFAAGANITLTTNNLTDTLTIAAAGGSSKLGFTPLSIYEATNKIQSVQGEEGGALSIIRQSVCETDCTIDKVDFFRLAGTERITIAVYTGTISAGTGNLRLLGGQSTGNTNQINTITFNTPYTFSAGDDIVILISIQYSTYNYAELLGATNLYSNSALGRENATFYNPPATDFSTIIGDFSSASTKAGALHFYDE